MTVKRPRVRVTRPAEERGQALVEFALILPVFLLILLAVADLGRVYTTIVQDEAGTREAADYGAFRWWYWKEENMDNTQAEMIRRACTAMVGLPDYVGASDGSSCTNPTVEVTMEGGGPCTPPLVSNPDPSCVIHVHTRYTFHLVLRFPPLPDTITIERDSLYLTGWQDI
jgi:Flp pilus assembly protein TadG